MRQISLDTETTGLLFYEGHRIIEIGCVEILDKKITEKIYHSYINPCRLIDKDASNITGITDNFLKDKPKFEEIVDDLFNFLNGADEIIIHNANFDVNFINNELRIINYKIKNIKSKFNIFDTLDYARKNFPRQKNSLDALCDKYEIDKDRRSFHGALIDAKLLANVYLEIINDENIYKLPKNFIETNHLNKTIVFKTLNENDFEIKNHINKINEIKTNDK